MTRGQKEYAIRMAYNRFDRWRDRFDCINRFSSYYYEALGSVRDAVTIGIRVALGYAIRFDDGFELIDDDTRLSGPFVITDTEVFAICRATEHFARWVDATGIIEEDTEAYDRLLAVIEDATRIGIRVATGLAIRFDRDREGALIRDKRKDFGMYGERVS